MNNTALIFIGIVGYLIYKNSEKKVTVVDLKTIEEKPLEQKVEQIIIKGTTEKVVDLTPKKDENNIPITSKRNKRLNKIF